MTAENLFARPLRLGRSRLIRLRHRIGEFGATAIVTRPQYQTIPAVIYRLLGRPGALNYGQALALSTILMLLTLAATLAIERYRFPGEKL